MTQRFTAPADFYMIAAMLERTGKWELISDDMFDRADAVNLYADWMPTLAHMMVLHVTVDGPCVDVTDDIKLEAISGAQD